MAKTLVANIKRGSQWYSGTAITGESTDPVIFADSGVEYALTNDYYLNTDSGIIYRCVDAGSPDTATWTYICDVIEVDKTLTVDGTAADSKTVGDRFALVDEKIANVKQTIAVTVPKFTSDGINDSSISLVGAYVDSSGGILMDEYEDAYISDIVYENGMFIILATNSIVTSEDGHTWAKRFYDSSIATINPISGPTVMLKKIVYTGTKFVAITTAGVVVTSSDGITWALETNTILSSTDVTVNDAAYGNGKIVVVCSNGGSYYSTDDGASWTAGTTGTTTALTCVAHGHGMFLALGTGIGYYSYDGISWIACSLHTMMTSAGTFTEQINESVSDTYTKTAVIPHKLIFADEKFVALGVFTREGTRTITTTYTNSSTGETETITMTESYDAIDYYTVSYSVTGMRDWIINTTPKRNFKDIVYFKGSFIGISNDSSGYLSAYFVRIDESVVGDKTYSTDFLDYTYEFVSSKTYSYTSDYGVSATNGDVLLIQRYLGGPSLRYANFLQEAIPIDELTPGLISDKNDEFNFGYLNGEYGFYTTAERLEENFYPFIQNVPRIIYKGTMTIASTSDPAIFFPLEKNSLYLIFVSSITISSGAVGGALTQHIYTSEVPSTGIGVILRVGDVSNGTNRATITNVATSTQFGFTMKPSAVGYSLIYSVIKMM